MNIKEIVEGMTAPQVAQVIKDNFNEVDKDKANKTDLNKSISDLASVVEANKTDLTKKIDNNKEDTDEKLSELGSEVSILGTTFELGDVNGGNGDLISGGKTLRSGFAKCYAGVNYKVSTSVAESNIGYIYFYDENKKFIKWEKLTYDFTPETSGYFVVVLGSGYGTIFKNDIAIFQQDGWRPDVANLIERIDNTNTELAATYQNMGDNLLTSSFELGDIGTGQGTPSDATSVIRTKDFCRCNKGTLIFVRPTINIARLGAIYWYDANQKYIKFDLLDYNEVETPDNALYFKIVLAASYGTTFNNDIRVLQKGGIRNIVKVETPRAINVSWENGDITSTGVEVSANTLRTTGYIDCSQYKRVYVTSPSSYNSRVGFAYYFDKAQKILEGGVVSVAGNAWTDIPEDAAYFRIVLVSGYGATYKNDIFFAAESAKPNVVTWVVAQDGTGDFTTLTEAVDAAKSGDVIYVKNGIYDNEIVRGWTKTLSIIGESKYGVQIMGDGNYSNPPLEMNSGVLKNLTIYAYGETANDIGRYAYAIHADNGILANNYFQVENCILKTKKGPGAVGMGMRGNCHVSFKDCDFINETSAAFFMNESVTAPDWNHTPGDQFFEFNNCKFICLNPDNKVTAAFEGYHSREGLVYGTFINCAFEHKGRTPYIRFYEAPERYWDSECENIEGNINLNGKMMINWFITESSHGNTIPALNYAIEGTMGTTM